MTNSLEASVAAKNPSLYTIDFLAFNTHEVETHLKKDVLHGEIGRHAGNTDLCCRLFRFVASTIVWYKLQGARLVEVDVRRSNPFAFAVVLV